MGRAPAARTTRHPAPASTTSGSLSRAISASPGYSFGTMGALSSSTALAPPLSPHQRRRRDCCFSWLAAQSRSDNSGRLGRRRGRLFVKREASRRCARAPAARPQREPASGSSGLSLSDRNARALFTRLTRHRSVCSGIRREQTARRARYRSRRKPRVTTPRAGSRLVLTGLSASRPALKIVGEVAVFATVRGCSHARALAPMRAGGAQRTTGTSSVERFGGSGAWCCSRIAVDGTKVDANVLPRERPRHLRRSRVR
jgi:hypothetical protein